MAQVRGTMRTSRLVVAVVGALAATACDSAPRAVSQTLACVAEPSANISAASAVSTLDAWHPVRAYRDATGAIHFFEIWNPTIGDYEHRVLAGYRSVDFGSDLDPTVDDPSNPESYDQIFRRMAASKANFTRMWLRPSDGKTAYHLDGGVADLNRPRAEFFSRLDDILTVAERHGVVVEVMLWDTSTGWGEGEFGEGSWRTCWADSEATCCPNVHNPNNHVPPLPLTDIPPCQKIATNEGGTRSSPWFAIGANEAWRIEQQAYMSRVMEQLRKHNNVTVEIINEAPPDGPPQPSSATENAYTWRIAIHEWIRREGGDILTQSNATTGWANFGDRQLQAWGEEEPGRIDMIASHDMWTYRIAQDVYEDTQGRVIAACNEVPDVPEGRKNAMKVDLEMVRRIMWGVTMGGGAAYIEDVSELLGGIVTSELETFFHPSTEPPEFWKMQPMPDLVRNNSDGSRYVLAQDDASEILIFSPGETPFDVARIGRYQYRWFEADGSNSSWSLWHNDNTWWFDPAHGNMGLQIRYDPDEGPTCDEMPAGWYEAQEFELCEQECPVDCVRKQVCGADGEPCQPWPNYCWMCRAPCGDGVCGQTETCFNCPADCSCEGRRCDEMPTGWYFNPPHGDCEGNCNVQCETKRDCAGMKCLDPYSNVEYCRQCPDLVRCGDGNCQPGRGENHDNCPNDCPAEPPPTNSCSSQGFYEHDQLGQCEADCGSCTRKQDCGGLPCDPPGYCWRCG